MGTPWIVISATRDGSVADALACAQLITPLDQVVVVASPPTVISVTAQLAAYPRTRLVLQPRDLGTAVELLHPLARVLANDPLGTAVFVPADCHVAAPRGLADAIQTASYAIAPHQVTLLGALPLDWITERNPFIAAGLVTTFWDQARCSLPAHAQLFERYIAALDTPAEDIALKGVFAELTPARLGRGLLARARPLAAVPLDAKTLQLRVLSLDRAAQRGSLLRSRRSGELSRATEIPGGSSLSAG